MTDGRTYSPIRKKLGLARAYLSRHPVWCAWQVTYRCNFRCTFCPYWKENITKPELSLPQIKSASRKLASLGSLLISIAGGEPLLRPDIVDVVGAIGQYHFAFLTTNGYLVTEELVKDFYKANLWGVSISIDYINPARHDAARGVSGSFERAVRALELFVKHKTAKHQRVNLMAVLMNDNLEDMEGLLKLAQDTGANFMVQPYSAIKTGDTSRNHPADVSRRLLDLHRKYPGFLSNPSFLAQFDQAARSGVPGCMAGRAFFNVDNYGNVARCVERRDQIIGNLLESDIDDILRGLHNVDGEKSCRRCWYNCRGEVECLYSFKGLLASLPIWLFDSFKNR